MRATPRRPHVLGIDDGPFEKGRDAEVPLVAVVMEGPDLVEGVAVTRFPVDGAEVSGFLADWIGGLRFRPALQAVFVGGITIAGLAVIDLTALARELSLPVIAVNRRGPSDEPLAEALRSAALAERIAVVERAPRAVPVNDRLWATCAGVDPERAGQLIAATRRKGELPEPLRLAHLIAAALVTGTSRGRA